MSGKPLALVSGAGSGLGQSLLARFEAGGMTAVGLGRSKPDKTAGTFCKVDLADRDASSALIADIIADHGSPRIVVHNTAELVIAPFDETSIDEFQRTWASMVQSLAILGQVVLEPMVRGSGGALIVSGATASLRGGARFAAFASAKFALRGLTQSLAREYQPRGIHVAHVILDGIIDTARSRDLHGLDPARMMKPDEIAETYWQIAHQPSSSWSHEVDLRPASESF